MKPGFQSRAARLPAGGRHLENARDSPRPRAARTSARPGARSGPRPGAGAKDTHGQDLPLQRLGADLPPRALQQLPQPLDAHRPGASPGLIPGSLRPNSRRRAGTAPGTHGEGAQSGAAENTAGHRRRREDAGNLGGRARFPPGRKSGPGNGRGGRGEHGLVSPSASGQTAAPPHGRPA